MALLRQQVQTNLDSYQQSTSDIAWLPDDPIAWIQAEFYIPETQAAIRLEPYQQQVLLKALTRDDDGNLPYSLVLWSDLKKSAKSTIAGAVVLWLAWHNEWETCRVVGNDLKQADSRTFYYIRRAIELNPRLKSQVKVKNYRIELPNHTTIDAIPVDPKGEAGGGDLIVCFTELWAAKNEAAKQLWTETTLSPLKYGKSLRWCESYAGFEGESPILEQLYEQGVKNGLRIDDDLELYENQAGRMLCLWNTTPRCPWQTEDYYAQEATVLLPEEFNRIHGNAWASATRKFVAIEWWDACKAEPPPLKDKQAVIVGIDAAVTHDCFAIVAVSRNADTCYVRNLSVWTPPKGGQIKFSEPEAELRRLAETYNVVCFTYDPTQMADMAQRLMGAGVGYFEPFNQGAPRLKADKELYDRILAQRIQHDGNPVLRNHIQNSDAEIDGEGHRLRIVHRAPQYPMDACVALSMACERAAFYNIG